MHGLIFKVAPRAGFVASTVALQNKLHCNKTALHRRGECERINAGQGAILFGFLSVNLHLKESRILECIK